MKKWEDFASVLKKDHINLEDLRLQEPSGSPIAAGDKVFTIGSCFARNIEEYLELHGLDCPVTKYVPVAGEYSGQRGRGILNKFTPLSILEELRWVSDVVRNGSNIGEETYRRFCFRVGKYRIVDLGLQDFLPVTEKRFYERRQHIFGIYQSIYRSSAIILTLGLIEQWYYKNLLIQHAPNSRAMLSQRSDFSCATLTEPQIEASFREICAILKEINPDIKIILTISPVPLRSTFSGQHVMVANTLSKSRLVSAVNASKSTLEFDYFPSYEIVQLIGNGAFESDLRHVKSEIVKAICQYFCQLYLH